MVTRFRRSIKILPGVRMNVSKSGVSYTIGKRGASVNVKPGRPPRTTIGIPGTGLSWTSTARNKKALQWSDAGNRSEKRMITTALLCLFLGVFGAHRFYVGRIGTGLLFFLTFGGFFVWTIIDLLLIVTGNFADKDGNRIT